MQLAQYLETRKITDAEFAKTLGVAQSTVLRLKRGERRPSLELAQRIAEVTAGEVQPSDFFTIPEPLPPLAAATGAEG